MGNPCYSVVKYLLFLINFLFVLAGLAVVGLGLFLRFFFFVQWDEHGILECLTYAIIGLGIVVTFISFSGCCGPVAEVRCLLMTYSIIMLILVLANVACIVLLFTYNQWQVETIFGTAFENKEFFEIVEKLLECCGTTGPDSYPLALPKTCCKSESLPVCNLDDAITVGCQNLVLSYMNIVPFYMIGIAVFEFMAVALAVYLYRSINETSKYK